jgi:hypothetical protein
MTVEMHVAPGVKTEPNPAIVSGHPTTTAAYDSLMVVLGLWLLVGMFADAWAHANKLVDTFFTPWHGIIYSGLAANAIAVFAVIWRNQNRGFRGWRAIPAGYEASAVGVVIFAASGVADMLWHSLLGIEFQLEAEFSPSHIGLMIGFFLLINGPFRSLWQRRRQAFRSWQRDWRDYLPLLLSVTFTLGFLWLTFVPFHPFYTVWLSAPEVDQVGKNNAVLLGMSSIVINVAIWMSLLLISLRRFQLLPGTVTFVLAFNALGICAFTSNWQFFPGAVVTGLLADVFLWKLRPSVRNLTAYRLFAALVPFVFYALYVFEVGLSTGIAWSLPFVGGVFIIPGTVGLLISYLIVPAKAAVIAFPE